MVNEMQLTPPKKRRLAEELYGQLLDQIVMGQLTPGDKLPTESALSKAMKMSRPVVREALMRLQADGLVVSRRGSGTYVQRAPSDDIKRFTQPQNFSRYMLSFEVRIALEPEAARLAARRATPSDISDLRAVCEKFAQAISLGTASQRQDLAFHMAIASASQNVLFVRLLSGIGEELQGFMSVSLGLTALRSTERQRIVLSEHVQIVDAIAARDEDLAHTYMRFHLSQARRRLTEASHEP